MWLATLGHYGQLWRLGEDGGHVSAIRVQVRLSPNYSQTHAGHPRCTQSWRNSGIQLTVCVPKVEGSGDRRQPDTQMGPGAGTALRGRKIG